MIIKMDLTVVAVGQVSWAVRELAQLDGLSGAAGGLVSPGGDSLVISELHNVRTDLLRGIIVRPGTGLG